MIFAIALNPKKCRRFTTKGINLSPKQPMTRIPLDLEDEFMNRIYDGLQKGEIVSLDENEMEQWELDGVGSHDAPDRPENQDWNTDTTVSMELGPKRADGKRKILGHTLTITGETSEEKEEESKSESPLVILTDIKEGD